jgi:hypothetical protein
MQDPECDFPRIHLPRGWVNNGKKRDIRERPPTFIWVVQAHILDDAHKGSSMA